MDNNSESTENENIYISNEKFIKIDTDASILKIRKLLFEKESEELKKFLKSNIKNQ